ncbi:hypothetical protein E3J74_02845 [Candidatus Bathyarchaeota archaeon]|nr:MAG: hypothetical protein E3J74_02845 [Candidatus Bathyarchaeota archaeon]
MGDKASTCLYISKEVVQTARKVGLNLSRISENALIEAIRLLMEPKQITDLNGPARVEGRGRDLNPGAKLHRPVGYQATPLFPIIRAQHFCMALN